MMTLEQIQQALHDRRLTVVAQETGISYGTLLAIRSGAQGNPTLRTMTQLDAYLRTARGARP